MAHIFNPSTWEAEAGRSLRVRGQPGLQREFQDSQGLYRESLSQKKILAKRFNIYAEGLVQTHVCPVLSATVSGRSHGPCSDDSEGLSPGILLNCQMLKFN